MCLNASIQKGVPKHTLLGDSGIHGMGLYAGQLIRAQEFVGEYKGEVITKEEADRRGAVYEKQKSTATSTATRSASSTIGISLAPMSIP
jgi:histone-lysine N-methyltransferase EZH2